MRVVFPRHSLFVNRYAAVYPDFENATLLSKVTSQEPFVESKVEIPPAESRVEKKQRRMMSRSAVLAAITLRELVSGVEIAGEDLAFFLGVGASQGSMSTLDEMLRASEVNGEFSIDRFGTAGLAAGNPLFVFQLMNNFTMCHAAILSAVRGPNGAFFSKGAGTVTALYEGAMSVLEHDAVAAIVGGADSAYHSVTRDELVRGGFVSNGFLPSEGAALLLIDSSPSRVELVSVSIGEAIEDDFDLQIRAQAVRTNDGSRDDTVNFTAVIGNALAATPALAWAAACEAIETDRAKRVCVLSEGIDGERCSVVFAEGVS